MIIKSIRKFIKQCPLLKNDKINVNYMSAEPIRYTIEAVPGNPVCKKYVDGGCLKQQLFVFASREYFTSDVLQNMDISQFYDDFSNWIDEQNKNRNLPDLSEDNLIPVKIEVLSGGYLLSTTENTARYQLQCKLIYYKD